MVTRPARRRGVQASAQRGIRGSRHFSLSLGEGLAAFHQTSFAKSLFIPASAFSGASLLISESAPKALMVAGSPILRALMKRLLCAAAELWAKDIVVSEAGSALPGKRVHRQETYRGL